MMAAPARNFHIGVLFFERGIFFGRGEAAAPRLPCGCDMESAKLSLEDTVRISDEVVFRELEGEAVLLNLATGIYFGL